MVQFGGRLGLDQKKEGSREVVRFQHPSIWKYHAIGHLSLPLMILWMLWGTDVVAIPSENSCEISSEIS